MAQAPAQQQEAVFPSPGDRAPDFTMPADAGKPLSLADFKGKKNVVLYFYPKDDTPGCTIEAKDFTCMKDQFDKANTIIIGVSRDDTKSHQKFKDKYQISFDLASDETGKICEAYNVWTEKSMYGKTYMGIERSTFLIDKTGAVRDAWRKVKVEGHAQEVLRAAQKL